MERPISLGPQHWGDHKAKPTQLQLAQAAIKRPRWRNWELRATQQLGSGHGRVVSIWALQQGCFLRYREPQPCFSPCLCNIFLFLVGHSPSPGSHFFWTAQETYKHWKSTRPYRYFPSLTIPQYLEPRLPPFPGSLPLEGFSL